uniref:Uncharacterized protein n=1 Tax=Ciona intestinalis TaxID=7719 RepID=H2XZ43_CIOIN
MTAPFKFGSRCWSCLRFELVFLDFLLLYSTTGVVLLKVVSILLVWRFREWLVTP